MRFALPLCLVLVLASSPALHAQAPAPAKPAATPDARVAQNRRAPAPAATPAAESPAPKKRGLLQRVFGGGKKNATPAPAEATATPAPATPRPRQKRRPAPARDDAPKPEGSEETPAPAPKEARNASKPKTSKTAAANADEESEPEEALTPEQQALKQAEASNNPEAVEKAKYDLAKSAAMQDEKIVALKEKADAANDEDEGRNALRAYNKALFQKMRTIDGSIRERVDLMEDAVMKRLEPATAAKK